MKKPFKHKNSKKQNKQFFYVVIDPFFIMLNICIKAES